MEANDFELDVRRAAELLKRHDVTGWELAELTAKRILTVNHRGEVRHERAEGRVSAKEWAHAVSQLGRKLSESSARAYARCWRRYGTNRKPDWTFSDHLQAAWGSNENAEARVEQVARRVHAESTNGGVVVKAEGVGLDEVETALAKGGIVGTTAFEETGAAYSETPDEYAARVEFQGRMAKGLKEVVLMFTLDEHEWFLKRVKTLGEAWGIESRNQIVLELVRRATLTVEFH